MLRNKFVSKKELIRELKGRLGRTSQAQVARDLDIASPLVSNILSGKINPCGKLLKWLGYERVTVYRKRS